MDGRCSVLTRPPDLGAAGVLATILNGQAASLNAAAVPPLANMLQFSLLNSLANSTRPFLSETENSTVGMSSPFCVLATMSAQVRLNHLGVFQQFLRVALQVDPAGF